MQQIVANYVTQSLHSRCTVENVFHIGGFREKICPDDMPKLSPSSVALLDGAIVLSRRDGTARWQARFKNGSRWIRVTTKAKDLNDAKEVARELYTDARYRVKHGIPAQSKRFKDVAKLAVDRMEKAMAAGEGRSVYRDYVQAINNYLIPFFGTHHVDHITYPLIQAFAAWRSEKMGKEPKASTINTYNSALNRIFDEALMRGYIAKTQVPSRIVLIEFKDYATALECYRSPEYAKAPAIHKNTADADIIILDGYEGPQPTDA
jgi:uncharacterized protein (DUF1330 family)